MKRGLTFLLTTLGLYISLFSRANATSGTINLPIKEDTYIEENFPSTAPWNNRNIFIGLDSYYNKGQTIAFFKADLPSYIQLHSSDIIKATLHLWQYNALDSNNFTVSLHIPQDSWYQETLTWQSAPQLSNVLATQTLQSGNIEQKFDITLAVKKVLDLNRSYIDFAIKQPGNHPSKIFWSTACVVTPDPPHCQSHQTPYIQIEYDINTAPSKPVIKTPQNNQVLTAKTINISWQASTDADGDSIIYKVEVFNTNNNLVHTEITDKTVTEVTIQNDGEYYIRVTAQDQHPHNPQEQTSDNIVFKIDTTPPSTPTIKQEPPFTYGNTNTIEWIDNSGEDNITFIIQQSLDEAFTQIVREEITTETSYKFSDINEKLYWYRVAVKDQYGNMSDWSNIVSSQQDNTTPQLSKLTCDTDIISPKNADGKLDYVTCNISIHDISFVSATATIQNVHREVVFTQTFDQKNFSINWNGQQGQNYLQDGDYFLQIEAIDHVDNRYVSDFIRITIDNTAPKQPNFISPKNKLKTNKAIININVRTEANTYNQLFINNKAVVKTYANKIKYRYLAKKDGQLKIKIISTDKAYNKTTTTRAIFIDTTPPPTPKFSLYLDKKKKLIRLRNLSSGFYKIYLYNLGGLEKVLTPKDRDIIVVRNYTPYTTYTFYGVAVDQLGNKSRKSHTVKITTPKPQNNIGGMKDAQYKRPPIPRSNWCYIRVNKTTNKIIKRCYISKPDINYITHYTYDNKNYTIEIKGSINRYMSLTVDTFQCKKKTFWDPATWFKCKEVWVRRSQPEPNFLRSLLITDVDGSRVIPNNSEKDQTEISRTFTLRKDTRNKQLESKQVFWGGFYVDDIYINLEEYSEAVHKQVPSVTRLKIDRNNKFFRFPFHEIVNVSQWHGKTKYEHPHTGIDFSTGKRAIYAIADGYIVAAQWDNYYGKCLSGGYFIKIKHTNGMYSLYLHLTSLKNKKGHTWKVGERVRKNELLAYSGNSGAFNCQPLGYHLHLELRKNKWQKSHVDPVPYIDVDWSKVRTAKASIYPGRLTGDNPHPTY